MYDLVIIGGGPAGVSAGVYAARKRLKTLFIAETVGGQSTASTEIQNWIGIPKISGPELARSLEKHLRAYAGVFVTIHLGKRVVNVKESTGGFTVATKEDTYETKTVLIASGGERRKLNIPGADTFEHKGVTYCASCDGPLFEGQDVVVVGGGNAGFETAAQLLAYAKSVTLIHRGSEFTKADATTVEAVLQHKNMRTLTDTEPMEVKGNAFVTSVVVKNVKTNVTQEIQTGGIFVEVGMVPNTDFVKNLVELDQWGRIVTDAKNQRTSKSGIWCAGDASNELYHQNNIASGDGVKALEDIYYHIHKTRSN
ncbi:MAG TPA: FAD-dependent oxidoreductase [Candidatus Paceibacterota bacterium]